MKVKLEIEGLFDNGGGYENRATEIDVPSSLYDSDNYTITCNNIMNYIDEELNTLDFFIDIHSCIDYKIIYVYGGDYGLGESETNIKMLSDIEIYKNIISKSVSNDKSEQISIDFEVVYNAMFSEISNLDFMKRFNIVLKTLSLMYDASTNTIKKLNKPLSEKQRRINKGKELIKGLGI